MKLWTLLTLLKNNQEVGQEVTQSSAGAHVKGHMQGHVILPVLGGRNKRITGAPESQFSQP